MPSSGHLTRGCLDFSLLSPSPQRGWWGATGGILVPTHPGGLRQLRAPLPHLESSQSSGHWCLNIQCVQGASPTQQP